MYARRQLVFNRLRRKKVRDVTWTNLAFFSETKATYNFFQSAVAIKLKSCQTIVTENIFVPEKSEAKIKITFTI